MHTVTCRRALHKVSNGLNLSCLVCVCLLIELFASGDVTHILLGDVHECIPCFICGRLYTCHSAAINPYTLPSRDRRRCCVSFFKLWTVCRIDVVMCVSWFICLPGGHIYLFRALNCKFEFIAHFFCKFAGELSVALLLAFSVRQELTTTEIDQRRHIIALRAFL